MTELIFKKVVEILSEIIDRDPEDIGLDTALTTGNGIMAIDVAKLVIECEKKFKITIHDEDVHTFTTVNDVVEHVERTRSER